MNTNIDLTQSDGPEVEESLLLLFLIERCNEILGSDRPKFSAVLQGLGLAALAHDPALHDKYGKIISLSSSPPEEIIRKSINIFQMALDRDPDRCSSQRPAAEAEEDGEADVKYCRRFMMQALREARVMAEQSDYYFFRVFALLAWIALQCDAKRQAEFDKVRSGFADDPESMVLKGQEILKDALFRPRTKSQSSGIPHLSNR
jgi:hypothetical protein